MGLGRPRKPTALLKLSGSADKHPERLAARANEPQPDPNLGNCPSLLTKEQKKIWKEIVSEIAPGVLTKTDRKQVEIAVRLLERIRKGTDRPSDISNFQKCLSMLGMNPVERSKVSVTPREPEGKADPFAEFETGDQPTQ
jgi:phage terminase small subunit